MDGVVVRRVMEADNSCLFNAVSYIMENTRAKGHELRSLIASIVASDPTRFNKAFLEKSNEDYVAWIRKDETWGGAIEISILTDHFKRKIAVFDIRTKRFDVFAEDKPYEEMGMLLYDGIHYDALALAPFADAPEDFDQTIVKASDLPKVVQLALPMVSSLQKARQYTDTSSFTLRCGICQKGLTGQKAAVEHAQATGHANFQEC